MMVLERNTTPAKHKTGSKDVLDANGSQGTSGVCGARTLFARISIESYLALIRLFKTFDPIFR